jgi:Ca-activated chloride channel family protein
MLVVAPPATPVEDAKKPKREVTLVIDRSGSMRGEKIEQARQAAEQVVEGLRMGEAFNIVDFSDTINVFSPTAVIKSAETLAKARSYIRGIQANGGTNIHDALLEALRKAPTAETLPLVLFMTDGLPTVGITGEVAIREAAKAANSAQRRIFSFGVGLDVNTPLLSNLSSTSRGAPTFILPSENVEQKLSQVFRRLDGPVLSSPSITIAGPGLEAGTRVIAELMPRELPDVFEGDQLVVMGQYSGASPIKLKLAGSYLGHAKDMELTLDPSAATVRHAFVPRLWASRKIASLIDSIRQAGAVSDPAQDPKTKELVDEIVTLSTKFGIMTEYTSFLATEPGVTLSDAERPAWMMRAAQPQAEMMRRMSADAGVRAGGAALGKDATVQMQTMNVAASRSNTQLYLDAAGAMRERQFGGVQQLADQSLFCRNNRWVDARLLKTENEKPDRTVEFGTPEFDELLTQLISENRQGMLAQAGEVLVLVNNQRVLVKMPAGID